jgi:hypothetical protein
MLRRLVRCSIPSVLCALVLLALATPARAQNYYYGRLNPGQSLAPGDWLLSPSGNYGLQLIANQGGYFDGALVFFDISPWTNLWTDPGLPHPRTPGSAAMQSDGNFVVYSSDCTGPYSSCWSTQTYGHNGAYLKLGDEGSLGVYDVNDVRLWCHPAGAPCTDPNPTYGVVTNWLGGNLGPKMTELGAGSVRLSFFWDHLQPTQGVPPDWTGPSAWVAEARSRGLQMFISLGPGVPAWAQPYPGCGSTCPPQLPYWYDFVASALAQPQFHGSDIVWGIWNEPDLGTFLQDDSYGTVYTWLFQYADAARNTVNPSARFGGPETSYNAHSSGYFPNVMSNLAPYLRASDVVTVHYYPEAPFSLAMQLSNVNYYAGGREIWVTEAGQSTCNDSYQSSSISNNILNQFAGGWASKLFIFVLWTDTTCDESLVRPDWTNRPAFSTYQSWIASH